MGGGDVFMEKKKSSIGYIIVIILLFLGFGGYILVDQGIIKLDVFNKKEEVKEEKKEDKKEELDINSRLVQNLYNMVTTKGINSFSTNWIYSSYKNVNDKNKESFYANKASEEIKMNIVGINLDSSNRKLVSCDNTNISIPGVYKEAPFDHEYGMLYTHCEYNEMQREYNLNKSPQSVYNYYYDRSYVETVYKTIFGKDAKLDTSAFIATNEYRGNNYVYVEEYDAYYEYIKEVGGTAGPESYEPSISSAFKEGKKLNIYEDVKRTTYENEDLSKPIVEEFYYVYTFELEDDGMYKFVSRVKEAK